MVTRLEGSINGDKVTFIRGQGDTWTGVIPPYDTGEYAVELTAYDAAGNAERLVTVLMTFDMGNVTVRLMPDKWQAQVKPSRYWVETVRVR
jgi:hypothetical protein